MCVCACLCGCVWVRANIKNAATELCLKIGTNVCQKKKRTPCMLKRDNASEVDCAWKVGSMKGRMVWLVSEVAYTYLHDDAWQGLLHV